ncbi:unnamed protein product [Ilex paraguariensis]|uniref:Uncharacterized protein n=1 Tax=Ilex paraguariensis TaxID=185542 RepID=A0ABC8SB24_9AQUA
MQLGHLLLRHFQAPNRRDPETNPESIGLGHRSGQPLQKHPESLGHNLFQTRCLGGGIIFEDKIYLWLKFRFGSLRNCN